MGWSGRAWMALGLLLLVAAGASGWRTYRLVTKGLHAVGVVVRSAPDKPGDRSPGHPIIEFRTADGRTVRAFQHGGAGVRYGTRLAVVYALGDPEGAVMADFGSLWTLTLVLGGLGVVLFVAPALSALVRRG